MRRKDRWTILAENLEDLFVKWDTLTIIQTGETLHECVKLLSQLARLEAENARD